MRETEGVELGTKTAAESEAFGFTVIGFRVLGFRVWRGWGCCSGADMPKTCFLMPSPNVMQSLQ